MRLVVNQPGNYFAINALIVADLARVNVDVHYVSEEEKASKEFKEKNFLNMYPFLETDDGQVIYDSQAISGFFARHGGASHLLGNSAIEQAQIDSFVAFSSTGVWPTAKKLLPMALGYVDYNKDKFERSVNELKEKAKVINNSLANRSWLAGHSLSLADVSVFMSFVLPAQLVFGQDFRRTVPNFNNWFEKIASLPAVVARAGYIRATQVAIKFQDGNAVFSAPVVEAAQAAPAKKAEPAAPKKEAKKEEDDVDVDDMDLFGDDDDDAAKEAAEAAKKKAVAQKKPKKVVIEKSLILFEVKPWGEETNLDDLAAEILKIEQDGLFWKTQYKKEPVAFGIYKLMIGATIEDAKVSVDDLQEKIESLEDYVQSVDIAAFNKV